MGPLDSFRGGEQVETQCATGRVSTPKIDRVRQLFLEFDTATGEFLKIGWRYGHISDK